MVTGDIMKNFFKNLEWVKFYSLKKEPFYYFPDNMTLIEFDENFGRLLTDLKTAESQQLQGYSRGYVEDVLYNMETLRKRGLMRKIVPSVLPEYIPLNKIILANTMKCNLACAYCYNDFDSNSSSPEKGNMTVDTFLEMLKFLERNGKGLPFYKLLFIGGEPLMNLEILEEAGKWGEKLRDRGQDLLIAVTTNGTLINKETIDFCMKYRINLKLTLDGDKGEHNLNRVFPDGKGSYETIAEMLPDYFYTYKNPSKYVATTIDTLRSDLEGRIIRLAAMGFNIIDLTEIYYEKKENDYNQEEIEGIFREKYRKVFDFLYMRVRSRNYLRIIPVYDIVKSIHQRKPSFTRCTAGLDSLSVSPDGTIYPCHHFYGDKRFRLGTVYDEKISSEKLKGYRIAVTERHECSDCWARLLCGGPCYHRSLAVTGDAFLCNKMECIRRKAMIAEALSFYIRLKNQDSKSLEYFMNMDKLIRSL